MGYLNVSCGITWHMDTGGGKGGRGTCNVLTDILSCVWFPISCVSFTVLVSCDQKDGFLPDQKDSFLPGVSCASSALVLLGMP